MKKLVLILTVAFVGVSAWSQSSSSDEDRKKELVGLTGFRVLVSVSPDSLASLLPINSIQTDVELKLRIAHIPVLPGDFSSWFSKAKGQFVGLGLISVSVNGVRHTSLPIWAISLEAKCFQGAQLAREPHVDTMGVSWVESTVTMYGESAVPNLRDIIKDWIDEFTNLYLAANP